MGWYDAEWYYFLIYFLIKLLHIPRYVPYITFAEHVKREHASMEDRARGLDFLTRGERKRERERAAVLRQHPRTTHTYIPRFSQRVKFMFEEGKKGGEEGKKENGMPSRSPRESLLSDARAANAHVCA